MEKYFANNEILKIIFKRRKEFLIIGISSVILSIILSSSFFIAPKFKSEAIIYPVNLNTYSSESESEQMIQILLSDNIPNTLIKKYNLYKHYRIDTTKKYFHTYVIKELENNVKFTKTEYESIVIEVMDESSIIAFKMVNTIIDAYNDKVREMQREKTKELIDIVGKKLILKRIEIDTLEEKIQRLRVNKSILDYNTQVVEATKGYLRTSVVPTNVEGSTKILNNLKIYGSEFLRLQIALDRANNLYTTLDEQLWKLQIEYDKKLTYAHIISKPTLPDKKSYPVRWLIILVSFVSVEFLALLLFLFFDSIGKINILDVVEK